MAIIAAVEAGGTKFICGLGNEKGEIIDKINIPTTTPEEITESSTVPETVVPSEIIERLTLAFSLKYCGIIPV